jgi:hypothetical protein
MFEENRRVRTAMATSILLTREFLIDRAARCRALASSFTDAALRERMLAIACDYEEIARTVDVSGPLHQIRLSEQKTR